MGGTIRADRKYRDPQFVKVLQIIVNAEELGDAVIADISVIKDDDDRALLNELLKFGVDIAETYDKYNVAGEWKQICQAQM